MTVPESEQPPSLPSRDSGPQSDIQPSWKPLLWLAGGLVVVIGLGEVLFDLVLEILEILVMSVFYITEGSEELLEDKIEEWFDLDPYHAEIITAWTMTPVKLLLAIIALGWLWRLARRKLFPKIAAYCRRQYLALHLAWQALAWPFKLLIAVIAIGSLAILV